jgi:hypothetical protein
VPGVFVHVPPSFTASNPFWKIVIFFHGRGNCVSNVVGVAPGIGCSSPVGSRNAFSLIKSFDAQNIDALLVVPENKYDDGRTSVAGQWMEAGKFGAFMTELLSSSYLGGVKGLRPMTLDKLSAVSIMAHSGGYVATASVLKHGGLSNIRQVVLFDSLYDNAPDFMNWIQARLKQPNCKFQFANFWSVNFDTAIQSKAMAESVETLIKAGTIKANQFLYDKAKSKDPLSASDAAFPLLFKSSGLTHNVIPTQYFPVMVAEFAKFTTCSKEGAMGRFTLDLVSITRRMRLRDKDLVDNVHEVDVSDADDDTMPGSESTMTASSEMFS